MTHFNLYLKKHTPYCRFVQSIIFLLIVVSTAPVAAQNSKAADSTAKNTRIKIIRNYSKISSVSELQNLFKNKNIFVDLWATWCPPCLEEFQYSDSLSNYLRSKEIELIYVSIDKEETDSKWKSELNKFNLYGYHIRANKSLRDSLTTLIWGAIDAYSIPHYLLFDKKGMVLNNNLPVPSSGNLFKEIEILSNSK